MNQEYVRKHYQKVAALFQDGSKSSIEDSFIRESENDFFLAEILNFISTQEKLPSLCDFGCGNGHFLNQVINVFPEINATGVEFSQDLFEICLKRQMKTHFVHADLREFNLPKQVDIAITQRVLINLLSWKWQKKALENIYHSLKPGGLYLLSESFKSSLINLNLARSENHLNPLSQSKHNRYLQKGFFDTMKEMGFEKMDSQIPENYLSTHFFTTRVLHELIRQPGTKIKNSQVIQFFDQALPHSIGDYSSIKFYVFKKV